MTLAKGTRLGAYEILEPIGAGGMGEVYKAKDTRIDRTVAIKVLPSGLADDAALKQRFEREAKSISSLNHPHICTLYEFDSHDGTDFLVMEHLEGESLAAHIARKGALPLDVALRYGIQIADALDGAHRQGVVHRDLKPGNVMLTDHGAKLLDFGLAKLAGPQVEAEVLSAVPTQAQPLTEKGAIFGTFQYMAPEQLEGEEADARTDVFAFGAVLYEMVTGKKAFEGKTQASLIAAILEREPEAMTTLQPIIPVALERVVKKCLAKKPVDRYHSMHDLADELRWITEGTPSDETLVRPVHDRGVLKLGIGVLVGALIAGLAFFGLRPGSSPPRVMRFSVELPEPIPPFSNFALAPDGTRLAYLANDRIHVRELDQLGAKPLPGTGGTPRFLEFSPDGQWIAYWAEGELRKVSISGGAPLRLCGIDTPVNPSWAADDIIRFGTPSGGIWQVPGNGGDPEQVVRNSVQVWGPQLLPDGRTFLFAFGAGTNAETYRVALQTPEDDAPRVIFEGADEARYLPSGHVLMHTASDDLIAAPFDPSRLEITGTPIPVVEASDWYFSVSQDGMLVYVPRSAAVSTRLVWVDRHGAATTAIDEQRGFRRPHLSPDGRRVTVELEGDVWVYDLERGTRTRATSRAFVQDPIWSPDGERIVYASQGGGTWRDGGMDFDIVAQPADGGAGAERLLTGDIPIFPHSFSPDGERLAVYQRRATGRDISILDLETKTAEPFVVTEFNERSPSFSPDGRFITYVSDASGRDEIYVQPYPGPGSRTVISTDGGFNPVWSRDGTEIFFRNGNRMLAARVETEPRFQAGVPETLFEGDFLSESDPTTGSRTYDVSPDGQRFLMIEGDEVRSELHVVVNWLEELKARVPVR